ncbi:MAG: hypothetical protein U5L08_14415 [Xanthomonadales bacterium]|nr:hypothetical protein [Xanthomonadales bacterium]
MRYQVRQRAQLVLYRLSALINGANLAAKAFEVAGGSWDGQAARRFIQRVDTIRQVIQRGIDPTRGLGRYVFGPINITNGAGEPSFDFNHAGEQVGLGVGKRFRLVLRRLRRVALIANGLTG